MAPADATDCQLLERFVRQRDEAAFAVVTRRHGARVLGVCRRVLRDEQRAQDVAQATFLVLARKAVAVPWGASVGSWLSAVAYRLALNARAAAARQQARERPAGILIGGGDGVPEPAAPDDDPLAATDRREEGGVLREEVDRLPEKYRAPVVLCYLEGKTNQEAARVLGWPSGSMARRLETARRILRERLTSRGIVVLLGLATLAALPFAMPSRRPTEPVARAMSDLKAADVDDLLRRLTAGEIGDSDEILAAARLGEGAMRAIRDQGPTQRRDDWRRHAEAAADSAFALGEAVRHDDAAAIAVAAGRLREACNRCHATFRTAVAAPPRAARPEPAPRSLARNHTVGSRSRDGVREPIGMPASTARHLKSSEASFSRRRFVFGNRS